LLAPLVRGRKGHYKELFEQTRKKGFLHVRIDGEMKELVPGLRVDRYKNHNIEVVIDRLVVGEKDRRRLKDSMQKAMQQGNGIVMLLEKETDQVRYFSKKLMCPTSGISYDDPDPHHFSFNSPHGACPTCKGLGFVNQVDMDKIIPDKTISIYNGGIAPLGKYRNTVIFWQVEAILEKYGCQLKTLIK
jgi:excinuclease ABC subunit A